MQFYRQALNIARVALALVFLLAVVSGCPSSKIPEVSTIPQMPDGTAHLILLGTSSVLSEIDPCGCEGNPTGGFAKKDTYLTLTRQSGIDPIVVDAGDLFFQYGYLPEAEPERSAVLAKAELILELLNATGIDAYVPGENDLAAGWDFLMELRTRSKFPFLAANLSNAGGGPALDAFVVINRNDVKIGIFGLVSPTLYQQTEAVQHGRLVVGDPIPAARKAVDDLKNQNVDFVVALAHLSEPELARVAKEVPGIAFIYSGHFFPQWGRKAQNMHGVSVFHANRDHKYLARLDVFLLPDNDGGYRVNDIVDGSNEPALRIRFEEANRELLRLQQAAGEQSLEQFYGDRPGALESIGRMRKQRREAAIGLDMILTKSHYVFRMVALDMTIGRSREIEAKILPWREEYAPESIPKPDELPPDKPAATPAAAEPDTSAGG